MTRGEISLLVAEKFASHKPSETYLDHLTSIARFKRKGDIYQFQHESIVKYLNSLW